MVTRLSSQFRSEKGRAISWQVISKDGNARAGVLQTRRSLIETPVFMPVGTQGTVKGIRFECLENELDARIILANTYHLFLRPGIEIIRACGGLHKFSSWQRSLLTDSGGFQVFSLAELRKIREDGVEFRSHIDGSRKFLSPEISMEIQAALGADIVMAFDECPPGKIDFKNARKSLELTLNWAERSKKRFLELQDEGADTGFISCQDLSGRQALFGIIQGAGYLQLRKESLDRTVEIGFDGYAIGGLSVGEEKSVMYEILEFIAPQMPEDKPRYLMGVGTPEDLLEAVSHGVDMFDCVLPTRNGRTGSAFTSFGKINIRNAKYATDSEPLDPNCACSVCLRYSRAYLRHLYQSGEMLVAILISHHNLAFFLNLMRQARQAIIKGDFNEFKRKTLEGLRRESQN
ncbi:MAG: tRNA guanosine(34) transglycosylase Tgt [Pyrinomonadaceae bacterium]|nr:tRNA guanosine(34) transglycosylase Tgt [Pyrinomonadaceae bacterium]MCX7640033.1 tRNA guanosine(34) transglycosylase Tgt [Pyrinomonadaceae bacterium]MDW8304205.1 tRNA guanosine(34) transglycosylase Tgt [Acidobacteriota bacterium]